MNIFIHYVLYIQFVYSFYVFAWDISPGMLSQIALFDSSPGDLSWLALLACSPALLIALLIAFLGCSPRIALLGCSLGLLYWIALLGLVFWLALLPVVALLDCSPRIAFLGLLFWDCYHGVTLLGLLSGEWSPGFVC